MLTMNHLLDRGFAALFFLQIAQLTPAAYISSQVGFDASFYILSHLQILIFLTVTNRIEHMPSPKDIF